MSGLDYFCGNNFFPNSLVGSWQNKSFFLPNKLNQTSSCSFMPSAVCLVSCLGKILHYLRGIIYVHFYSQGVFGIVTKVELFQINN